MSAEMSVNRKTAMHQVASNNAPMRSSPASSRRRIGAWIMAILAWCALVRLRSTGESFVYLLVDSAGVFCCLGLTAWLRVARTQIESAWKLRVAAISAITFPIAWGIAWRFHATGAAWEMLSLEVLGVLGGLLSLLGSQRRFVDFSVACSGFLVLFTTAISDHTVAALFAMLWGACCMWWLVANHWERLEVALVRDVRRRAPHRSFVLFGAMAVVTLSVLLFAGRTPATRFLEWGISPFSGGNRISDASARSGVGEGDAIVAAREHAASFGPVETDVFMESRQSSLFDLANDAYGNPFKKTRSEKAIALSGSIDKKNESKIAKSERSSQSFTTARSAPIKEKRLEDRKSDAVCYWVGRPGIRLAMQRYDHFDGIDWSCETGETKTPHWHSEKIQDRVWFFFPKPSVPKLLVGAIPEALKVIHLDSPRIPSPETLTGWHVDLVDRADFFGLTADESLAMDGRERVPELTVLRMVSNEVDRGQLEQLSDYPRGREIAVSKSAGQQRAAEESKQFRSDYLSQWERVEAVVDWLRNNFVVDRSRTLDSEDPLGDFFLKRSGPEYMFATAACSLLNSMDFNTRLVSGFYVRPDRLDRLARQTIVAKEDVHTWAEVEVAPDLWIPVEPSPGYEPPRYHLSLWYRARIAAIWVVPTLIGLCFIAALVWRVRGSVMEFVSVLIWKLFPTRSSQRRVSLLIYLLDTRCKIANCPRPAGVLPQVWYSKVNAPSNAAVLHSFPLFFRLADRLFFGDQFDEPESVNRLANTLFREFRPTKLARK